MRQIEPEPASCLSLAHDGLGMNKIGTKTIVALSVFVGTAAVAQQGVNLSGPYRCVQRCAGSGIAFVAQSGWRLSLMNEAGQRSRAWIDRPGRIWVQSWNEGAIYSPDGMTLQFDRGSVWRRDLEARANVVIPRRADVVPPSPPPLPPSAWDVYQSLRRPYLCYLPSEPCDNTQRLTN
jgi:hypothetical protein